MSTAFLSAIVTASFLSKDDNAVIFDKKLSTFNFCPPQTDSVTYQTVVDENNNVTYEVLVDAPETTRSKPSSSIYTGGCQLELEDVLSTIANIVTFLKWAVKPQDEEQDSDIVSSLTKIFKLLSFKDFKEEFNRFHPTMKWIAHSLLTLFQGVFQTRAKFATTEANIATVFNGYDLYTDGIPSLEMYDLLITNVTDEIKKVIATGGMIGTLFQAEPPTYKFFFPPDINMGSAKRQKTSETNRSSPTGQRANLASSNSTASHPDKGFIQVHGHARFPTLSCGKPMCGNWSTVG
jgi:hypothetical protein